jgi:RHS repeat-associated protein
MKIYVAVAITVIMMLANKLHAQQCYSPIPSFQGTYTTAANAQGVACGSGGTCNVSESITANANDPTVGVTCSEVATLSLNDTVVAAAGSDQLIVPCGSGGSETLTLTGSGAAQSGSALVVNPGSGTQTYAVGGGMAGTLTTVDCSGETTSIPEGVGLTPGSNFPTPYSLPGPTAQELSDAPPQFNGESDFSAVVPWTFSYDLKPNYDDDDDCKKKGGSTVGCQNQSLGEDMPVVGTGFILHYESGRAPGSPGDAAAIADASQLGGWTLSVHHTYDPNTNALFFGDGTQRNGYQLGTPVSYNGNLLLTSEDGSEVYVFTTAGEHLQTLRPLTGALKYQFAYDSAGKLITVTDAVGNVTTIQRNGTEQATAIVSPYGQTTTLTMDANGLLSQVTDPLGNSSTFVNSSAGLLNSRTDQNGNIYNYTYDATGRLTKDADPLGGYLSLGSTPSGCGVGSTVSETTALSRTSGYQSCLTLPWVQNGSTPESHQRTITWPDGLVATSSKNLGSSGQLSDSYSLPDGTTDSKTLGPDPVWGLQVPVDSSETVTLGSLTTNIVESRSTTLGTAGNPFTVTAENDVQTVNGRSYTSTFTGSTRTWLDKTPVGRTLTIGLDKLERVSSTKLGTLAPIVLSYDSHGRIATSTQSTRKTTLSYNANGFLASVTDPLKLTTSYAYDADGHLSTTTLPDGRVIGYTYDANGNLTSVTPPGKSAHDFAYNAVDLMSSYTPPSVSGTGATTYSYNLDRDLTQITRPDGQTIQYGYDSGGRLNSITTPTETIAYSFDPNTGNLTNASISGGEALAYSYNGPLLISSALSGTVAGTVSRSYNDNFWVSSESLGGSNTVNFTYDNDGFVTKAGSLTVKLNAKDSLITGTTLGGLTDARTYNTFGELTAIKDKYKTTALYAATYTRDADGRISGKTETVGGASNTYVYTFDAAGRLTAVTKNGASLSSYTYDSNSNRLSATTSSGTVTGTYDAQDRLLTYGNASFTYTANGELASQTVGTQTTSYTYDVFGNLVAVTLPNGTSIQYIVDPKNHRVGKVINGTLQSGYLYDQDGRLVAQLNGSNQIASQFVYGTGSLSPDYMISGGVTYRIFSDPLGSPLLVVNSSTGVIAEQISYDEFGNVLSDTNPGFQPFGFAGGLYDQDTKLVRFGARDYNPTIGRWSAKDPILFGGGDTDLYSYALNDPINVFDPSGSVSQLALAVDLFLQRWLEQQGLTPEEIKIFQEAAASIEAVFSNCIRKSPGYIRGGLSYLGNGLGGVVTFIVAPFLDKQIDNYNRVCDKCMY